jgi:GTP cyclohydrolase I
VSANIRRLPRPRLANESMPLGHAERAGMIEAAAEKLRELFDILEIDHKNDHNTRETPARVARMLVQETLRGRFSAPPVMTEFLNAQGFRDMIVTGPIEVRSTCAHHLMPIYGSAYIGILPSLEGTIIGLSKYDRIVDYFAGRLQMQEEMVRQIGDYIVEQTRPRGVAIRVSAVHMCRTHRGVHASGSSRMVTSAYFGEFQLSQELKREFQHECLGLERSTD